VCEDPNEARRTKEQRENNSKERFGFYYFVVVVVHTMNRLIKFLENIFPYKLPEETHHWVLWFMLDEDESETTIHLSDEQISKDITERLKEETNGDTFQFVWYRNPKPSVADDLTYHVQVFWRA
jgi:Protein of unknown function (DUF3605)